MKQETQLAQLALQSIGATLKKDTYDGKPCVRVDVSARGTYELWSSVEKLKSSLHEINLGHVEHAIEDQDNGGWRGGTASAVRDAFNGKFDTARFRAAQEKLKGLIVVPTLDAMTAKKRTRFLSEYDGEYDFDRRYDLTPFNATRIERGGVVRTLDIDVEFCFNAGVSAQSISEYGALAWSIVDIVERAGIQVNLRLVMPIQHDGIVHDENAEYSKIKTAVNYISLKKSGEYVETMTLARCFTSMFFRRCTFVLDCIVEQARGRDTDSGLGYPVNTGKSSAERGRLYIGTEAIGGATHRIAAIGEFLKTALGVSLTEGEK